MPDTTRAAVRVRGLRKDYGRSTALAGLDLTIPEGSLFGLLGPNGAGKTTLIGALCNLVLDAETHAAGREAAAGTTSRSGARAAMPGAVFAAASDREPEEDLAGENGKPFVGDEDGR